MPYMKLENAFKILIDRNIWTNNGNGTNRYKMHLLVEPAIQKIVLESTEFLPIDTPFNIRLYHVKHNLKVQPKCLWCKSENAKYSKSAYTKTCSKECHHLLKANNAKLTKTAIDESGTSIAERAYQKINHTLHNTIDELSGKTLFEIKNEKARKSNMTPNAVTGLTPAQVGGRKGGDKKMLIQHDGTSIAHKARIKQIKTLKNNLDSDGISQFDKVNRSISTALLNSKKLKVANKLSGRKRKETVQSNGLTKSANAAYKGVIKCRITKEINGTIIPKCQMSAWKLYCREVLKHTFNNNLYAISNWDKRGNHASNLNAWHLDHKFSCFSGFKEGILPSLIGNIHNLEMLPWKENVVKGTRNSITLDELIMKIKG